MSSHQALLPLVRPIEYGRMLTNPQQSGTAPIIVHTAQWQHLASARFGPGRPCSLSPRILWSGDCYRYDIFLHSEMKWLALRWWNGSGEGWLISPSRESRNEQSLLRHIASIDSEALRWGYCHFLWEAVESSRIAGQLSNDESMQRAILEKRIKIRRRNGQKRVVIQPRMLTREDEAGHVAMTEGPGLEGAVA